MQDRSVVMMMIRKTRSGMGRRKNSACWRSDSDGRVMQLPWQVPALEIVKVCETNTCLSNLSPTHSHIHSPSSVPVDMYVRRHCTLPVVSVNYDMLSYKEPTPRAEPRDVSKVRQSRRRSVCLGCGIGGCTRAQLHKRY
jgi:hypothetical protein